MLTPTLQVSIALSCWMQMMIGGQSMIKIANVKRLILIYICQNSYFYWLLLLCLFLKQIIYTYFMYKLSSQFGVVSCFFNTMFSHLLPTFLSSFTTRYSIRGGALYLTPPGDIHRWILWSSRVLKVDWIQSTFSTTVRWCFYFQNTNAYHTMYVLYLLFYIFCGMNT